MATPSTRGGSTFSAIALPDGDPEWDISGPLIMLVERHAGEAYNSGEVRRVRFLAPEEAIQLARTLADAAFRLGLKEAGPVAIEEPVL